MEFLLDTNIIIHWVRKSEKLTYIESLVQNSEIYISAVTQGELLAFAKINHWGSSKIKLLSTILSKMNCVPIQGESGLVNAYADIQAFSQGKHPDITPDAPFSSRNMGKNDLWIAATAFWLDLPLITTDNDFDHLTKIFIEVVKI